MVYRKYVYCIFIYVVCHLEQEMMLLTQGGDSKSLPTDPTCKYKTDMNRPYLTLAEYPSSKCPTFYPWMPLCPFRVLCLVHFWLCHVTAAARCCCKIFKVLIAEASATLFAMPLSSVVTLSYSWCWIPT